MVEQQGVCFATLVSKDGAVVPRLGHRDCAILWQNAKCVEYLVSALYGLSLAVLRRDGQGKKEWIVQPWLRVFQGIPFDDRHDRFVDEGEVFVCKFSHGLFPFSC